MSQLDQPAPGPSCLPHPGDPRQSDDHQCPPGDGCWHGLHL